MANKKEEKKKDSKESKFVYTKKTAWDYFTNYQIKK
jgi:hypothetical protein